MFSPQLRKKQNIVEQAGQLKRFIVSLQLAADKREQSEKNLRYKLEKEVEALRLGSKQVRYLGADSWEYFSCIQCTDLIYNFFSKDRTITRELPVTFVSNQFSFISTFLLFILQFVVLLGQEACLFLRWQIYL